MVDRLNPQLVPDIRVRGSNVSSDHDRSLVGTRQEQLLALEANNRRTAADWLVLDDA
ncbi:hypothetical protein PSAC2689_160050 [Paraburkholderia sacchari]